MWWWRDRRVHLVAPAFLLWEIGSDLMLCIVWPSLRIVDVMPVIMHRLVPALAFVRKVVNIVPMAFWRRARDVSMFVVRIANADILDDFTVFVHIGGCRRGRSICVAINGRRSRGVPVPVLVRHVIARGRMWRIVWVVSAFIHGRLRTATL